MGSYRSRRLGVWLTWFSVFLILTGVFSWVPAAAEDATPTNDTSLIADPTAETTIALPTAVPTIAPPTAVPTDPPTIPPPPPPPTDPPAQTMPEPSSSQQSLNTTSLDDPIEVASVSLVCPAVGNLIEGTLTVVNAQTGASIVLKVMADLDEIDTHPVPLTEGRASYSFNIVLHPEHFSDATEADVTLVAFEGVSTSATPATFSGLPLTSDPIPVDLITGVPQCAPEVTVDPSPTPLPTEEPTTEPTVTPIPEPATGTVSNTGGSNLRCRAEPNTSSMTFVLLPPGSSVEVRGPTTNGWVPVRCDGQDGFVSAMYLTVTNPPTGTPTPTPPPGGTTFATVSNTGGSNLRCRTTPITGATIVLLALGTTVEVRGESSDGWAPIRCGGRDGWASTAYLTFGGSTPPGPLPTPPPVTPAPTTHATVSGTDGNNLRCRTVPETGDTIVLMAPGSRVELRGQTVNGWAPITCAGQAGWASAMYLLFDVGAGSGELWIDVNLSTQYMRVFRGSDVIMESYVSTGKNGFLTPTGTFYINRKLPLRTMTGTLGGEYYYVPNVPDVMYFTNVGHAIHGAYWHNSFGSRRSHGCINLPLSKAAYLYSVTPIGTRVRIHY